MRKLLVLSGIGILSTAAGRGIADDGVSKYGKMHIRPGHGGLEYHMRHGGGHFAIGGQLGVYFPTPPGLYPWESEPGPAPSIPTSGLVIGGTEHMTAGHLTGQAIHPHIHVSVQVISGQAVISQSTAASVAKSNQTGTAMAQPTPTVSPSRSYPPGATGPGVPVSGWPGPGLPGPGQPASSGW